MEYTYFKLHKPDNRPSVYYRKSEFSQLEVYNNSEQCWVVSMYRTLPQVLDESGYSPETVYVEKVSEDSVFKELLINKLRR